MAYTDFSGTLVVPTDLAKIYFADRAVIDAATAWTEPFWTLKNSLTFDQVQGAKTEINVDQTTAAIAVKYAAGTTTFTFRIPDMNETVQEMFYNSVAVTGAAVIKAGVTGYGFSDALVTVKDKMVMLMYTNGWGIVFPHCEMVAAKKKSGEEAWTLDITGTVLAGDAGGEAADYIILQPN